MVQSVNSTLRIAVPLLTPRQVRKLLKISRSTLYRWELKCGPLEGDPLIPVPDPITGAKRYPRNLIDRIRAVFKAAKKGRYVDKNGIVLVDQERARKLLAPYWHRKGQRNGKGPTDRTFSDWHANGCIHLPNCERIVPRLLRLDRNNVPRAWYKEEKILEIKKSLIFIRRHGHPSDSDLFTVYGIAAKLEIAPKRVYDWMAAEKIEPTCKAGKWGVGGRKNQTRYFSLSAARELLIQGSFDGIYREPAGNRYNPNAAARFLGHGWPQLVRKYIRDKKFQVEDRERPFGRRITEPTIAEKDLVDFKKPRDRIRRTKKPTRWARSTRFVRFLQSHGCADRDAARDMEKRFRANPKYAQQFANGRKDQLQLVWHYNLEGISAELDAGRSLSDIAVPGPKDQPNVRAQSATAQSDKARNERRGPQPDPAIEEMSHFCYENYVAKKLSRKESLKIVRDKFPDSAPSTPDALKVYARRYAKRHGLPWRQ